MVSIVINIFGILHTGISWFFSWSAFVVVFSGFHEVGMIRHKNTLDAPHVQVPSYLPPDFA